MAVEDHAEQIECLTLVPVRGFPNAGHGRRVRPFLVYQRLLSDAMVSSC